jgi:hypothetical protein
MALTGKFIADFSDFQTAVAKADVSLKSLGEGASKVGPQLNRMVDQFSGRKLIQDAEIMVRAIDEIGGVSKLTSKELASMAGKASEASEKMRALGMEVPKGLQDIADKAKPASDGLGSVASQLKGIAGALGIGFSIGAVVNLGKEILGDVDALQRMHAQTGISLQGLQRFQIAGDDAGNSIDQITSAISKMEDNFASANPVALKALTDLKIPLEDIKNLNPENQFIEISNAIRQIQDPAERTRLAIDLFGKAGAQVLPTLVRGFDDVKGAAVGMSDETIKRLDDASDRVGAWYRTTKGYLALGAVAFVDLVKNGFDPARAGAAQAQADMAALNTQIKEMGDAIKKPTIGLNAMAAPLKVVTSESAAVVGETRRLDEALKAQTKSTADAKAAHEKLAGAVDKVEEATTLNTAALGLADVQTVVSIRAWLDLQQSLGKVEREFTLMQAGVHGTADGLDKLGTKVEAVSKDDLADFIDRIKFVGPLLEDAGNDAKKFSHVFGDAFSGLNAIMQRAFEGGGGIGGAIKSYATQITSNVLTMIPVVGQALSQFAGAAIAGVQKVWGALTDKAGKETNNLRDAFIAAAGGLDVLNMRAHDAGLTLDALLDASKPKDYEAAIKDLQAAFEFQTAALATLDETAKKYGFTIEELGPALQRQELDQQAQTIFKDWEILNAAGIDTIAITTRMADSVNAYVQQAIAMGGEVPEAMRPMLQKMVEMGTLTDASGNKIENLEDSGVSFAMTMSQGFQSLIESVGKLTDAISRGLGLAVDTSASKLRNMPRNIDVGVSYVDPGFERTHEVRVLYNTDGRTEIPGFASGTEGFQNFGAGTPVMLHGWEAVIPRDQTSAMPGLLSGAAGGASVGETSIVINVNAQGAFFETPGSLQQLASKVEEALSARHGLKNKRRAA